MCGFRKKEHRNFRSRFLFLLFAYSLSSIGAVLHIPVVFSFSVSIRSDPTFCMHEKPCDCIRCIRFGYMRFLLINIGWRELKHPNTRSHMDETADLNSMICEITISTFAFFPTFIIVVQLTVFEYIPLSRPHWLQPCAVLLRFSQIWLASGYIEAQIICFVHAMTCRFTWLIKHAKKSTLTAWRSPYWRRAGMDKNRKSKNQWIPPPHLKIESGRRNDCYQTQN